MRPFLLSLLALSACARPMSAPVAVAHTGAPRAEPLSLSRFELADVSAPAPRSACPIGPSELACETKLLASAVQAEARGPDDAPDRDALAITGEDGALLYAQALRTGVSQARRRSSLPVTARK